MPATSAIARLRRVRSTVCVFDTYSLVADDSESDLRAPHAALLRLLFPKSTDMRVLTNARAALDDASTKFYVSLGKSEGCVVTIGSRATIERLSGGLERARKAARSAPRLFVPAAREAVFEGDWGAMAVHAVLRGAELAPTLYDEARASLHDEAAPGRGLIPLPRQVWQRGSPLHELAVETASRRAGFGGADGTATAALATLLDALAALLPAEQPHAWTTSGGGGGGGSADDAAAAAAGGGGGGGDEGNSDGSTGRRANGVGAAAAADAGSDGDRLAEQQRVPFASRFSPKLMRLLEGFGSAGQFSGAASSPKAFP